MRTKHLAILQLTLGALGIVAVLTSYFVWKDDICKAINHLAGIAEAGELQIRQTGQTLSDFQRLAAELDESTSVHIETVDAAVESTEHLSSLVDGWKTAASGFVELFDDAGQITDSFQKELPISVPHIGTATERKEFQVPKVTLAPRKFKLNKLDLSVTVDDFPNVKLVKQSVSVPRIESRQLMTREKALLQKVTREMNVTAQSLRKTATSLDDLTDLLRNDVDRSLRKTKSNLASTAEQLDNLHATRLPSLINQLQKQQAELERSRTSLVTLTPLVPLAFSLMSLLPLSVFLSGLINMCRFKTSDT